MGAGAQTISGKARLPAPLRSRPAKQVIDSSHVTSRTRQQAVPECLSIPKTVKQPIGASESGLDVEAGFS